MSSCQAPNQIVDNMRFNFMQEFKLTEYNFCQLINIYFFECINHIQFTLLMFSTLVRFVFK